MIKRYKRVLRQKKKRNDLLLLFCFTFNIGGDNPSAPDSSLDEPLVFGDDVLLVWFPPVWSPPVLLVSTMRRCAIFCNIFGFHEWSAICVSCWFVRFSLEDELVVVVVPSLNVVVADVVVVICNWFDGEEDDVITDNGLGTIFVAACRILDCFTPLPATDAPLVIKLIEDNAAERQSWRNRGWISCTIETISKSYLWIVGGNICTTNGNGSNTILRLISRTNLKSLYLVTKYRLSYLRTFTWFWFWFWACCCCCNTVNTLDFLIYFPSFLETGLTLGLSAIAVFWETSPGLLIGCDGACWPFCFLLFVAFVKFESCWTDNPDAANEKAFSCPDWRASKIIRDKRKINI